MDELLEVMVLDGAKAVDLRSCGGDFSKTRAEDHAVAKRYFREEIIAWSVKILEWQEDEAQKFADFCLAESLEEHPMFMPDCKNQFRMKKFVTSEATETEKEVVMHSSVILEGSEWERFHGYQGIMKEFKDSWLYAVANNEANTKFDTYPTDEEIRNARLPGSPTEILNYRDPESRCYAVPKVEDDKENFMNHVNYCLDYFLQEKFVWQAVGFSSQSFIVKHLETQQGITELNARQRGRIRKYVVNTINEHKATFETGTEGNDDKADYTEMMEQFRELFEKEKQRHFGQKFKELKIQIVADDEKVDEDDTPQKGQALLPTIPEAVRRRLGQETMVPRGNVVAAPSALPTVGLLSAITVSVGFLAYVIYRRFTTPRKPQDSDRKSIEEP